MALLSFKDLSIGYDNNIILDKLNFDVEGESCLCIVGQNGSGKSTLMKTILGLIPKISGEIILDSDFKQTQIGYLPQQTEVQKDFPASVYEIVISGCQNRCGIRPFYNKNEKLRAESNMKKLNIFDLKNKCYRELSGGQQQRVLLARALCATEKLLLLDEPVTGLDPKATADFYQMIADLNQNDKITVIMISHDIDASLDLASHILHIGDTVFFGTKDEYLKSNAVKIFNKEVTSNDR